MATSKLIKAILLPKPATPLMVLTQQLKLATIAILQRVSQSRSITNIKQQPLSRRYLAIIPTGLSMMVACKGTILKITAVAAMT